MDRQLLLACLLLVSQSFVGVKGWADSGLLNLEGYNSRQDLNLQLDHLEVEVVFAITRGSSRARQFLMSAVT